MSDIEHVDGFVEGDAAEDSGPRDPLQVLAADGSGLSANVPIATKARTFKFRVWDGERMTVPDDGEHVMFFNDPKHIEWGLYSRLGIKICDNQYGVGRVMQFTGLKDKNGQDIYEGDLLKHPDEEDPIHVVWHQPTAGFGLTKRGWMYCHYFREALEAHDCEVIGNIYEPLTNT